MSLKKREYHAQRAEIELKLGDLAADARVAAVHYELALRYSILAARESAKDRALSLIQSELESAGAAHSPRRSITPSPWDERLPERSFQPSE
ncbi:MAG TPA: hypothetical protein VNI79_05930 [Sphingomicrobium sp.]|nr:hypothetical protein [Sphingomicrobium sp.]